MIGSGGREHALALALAKSPRVSSVICVPGNGGCSGGKLRRANVSIKAPDFAELIAFCQKERVRQPAPAVSSAYGRCRTYAAAGCLSSGFAEGKHFPFNAIFNERLLLVKFAYFIIFRRKGRRTLQNTWFFLDFPNCTYLPNII